MIPADGLCLLTSVARATGLERATLFEQALVCIPLVATSITDDEARAAVIGKVEALKGKRLSVIKDE